MKPWNVACARFDGARHSLFGISTNIQEPSKLEGRWLALSSSAQADCHAVKCLSTPCQFCARLCTSDCSKSGLVGGLDRITCAHNFHVTKRILWKSRDGKKKEKKTEG